MGSVSGHNDLHVDKLISQMCLDYKPEGFIADQIMPIVSVAKQADFYSDFSRADKLRVEDTKRSPDTEARRIEISVGSGTFFCTNYALQAPVTLEDTANADEIFIDKIINGRVELVMDKLLLDWELRVATQVLNTSNVGSSSAVSSAWNGAGAPLSDLNTAIDNVRFSNGVRPNHMVFGLEAWLSFRRDSTVRNLIFGTNNGGGYPSTSQVSELLEIDNVLIGGAFRNTGQEGQSESLSTIWGDKVLTYYAPESPNKERPSFAYSFRWSKPGLPNFIAERHPFNTLRKSSSIEVGYYQDEVITGATYGFLLDAVNSST
jgi:hypothetical protein